MKRGDFLEPICWTRIQEHIVRKCLEPPEIVARLFVPPVASASMNVPAIISKTNPLVTLNRRQVRERKRRCSRCVVAIAIEAGYDGVIFREEFKVSNPELRKLIGGNATIGPFKVI